MPNFQVVSVSEATQRSAKPRTNPFDEEYVGYIERLGAGQAGKLIPSDGETARAIRLCLTRAAKAAGKTLKVVRTGDDVYFWNDTTRRRGRPRKRSSRQ